MLSYDEACEYVSLGLHNDTYLDRQEAQRQAAIEAARRTRNRLRRISARLHQLAHEAWHDDEYGVLAACLEAAGRIDQEAPPTKRMAQRYEDQAITRWHYENPDARDYGPDY